MIARIRDSHTGERCECGEGGGHETLTPGDGLCTTCYRARVDEQLAAIKAEADALTAYIDAEDPHAERISDDVLANLNLALHN